MKPVNQTRVGPGNGNCWTACIASILELPIDQVPDFIDSKDFYGATVRWLHKRGLTIVQIDLQHSTYWPFFYAKSVFTILTGASPRGDWKHAVVGDGLVFAHDPHPDNKMLKGDIEYVYLLVPTQGKIRGAADEEDDDIEGTSGFGEEYSDEGLVEEAPVPKRRGRPAGSKNRAKP